ncbi:MAG: hypothetical protein ABII76_24460 [Pseudomonadota bacterium]|uniref:alginate O-acetyltransferase AlgX-related protein n=1 Tax=Roseixanthobacter finlandensis TaxID=3119922 RepID=UPI00372CBBD0
MALLVSYRRYMGALVMGILTLLLLSNLIPDPLGFHTWRGLPREDAGFFQRLHGNLRSFGFYLQDNFGFRASMPVVRRTLRDLVWSPDTTILYIGPNGQMFWSGERAPEQTAGQLYRVHAVERFVALMKAMQDRLPHTKLVVAIPPNAQTVDVNDLPTWYKYVRPRPTEYSLMLADLQKDGITAVDLRAVLKAAPGVRHYLPNDTHWTHMSAAIAFNATMVAAGHPDWQVDLSKAVGPMEPIPQGDLARLLRIKTPLADENQRLNFDPAWVKRPHPALRLKTESRQFTPYAIRFRESGPRVLVVGDSYTATQWPGLFGFTPVAEVGWMHFSRFSSGACDFDFADIRDFNPDVLIIARTERLFPCLKNKWPDNLPPPPD